MTLRWRFPDPAEAEARAEVDRHIDAFWMAVEAWGATSVLPPPSVADALRVVSDGLEVVASHGRSGQRLIVSAGDRRALEPLVDQVVSRAPPLPRLVVSRGRGPEPIDAAVQALRHDVAGWSVEVQPVKHGLLALTWHGTDGERAHDVAAQLSEVLLGERELADWVHSVELAPPSLRARVLGLVRTKGVPAAGLRAQVAQLKSQRLATCADRPLLVRSANPDPNWTLMRLDPGQDRAGCHQPDLERASCADVELFEASRCGAPFSSARFSRFGETFAYVQTEGFGDEGVQTTLALEQAIDAALKGDGLGRAIGTGTGTRCSYVDLVLADVPRALERLTPALRSARLPTRAWVRFFDDALAAEWAGVWPETPAPSA
ncbi:MAG: hypothetical protein JNJ54_06980 [Myxococcaceae bacterium]|nr:hypothetical protein [Myxococcaceae bacterium]